MMEGDSIVTTSEIRPTTWPGCSSLTKDWNPFFLYSERRWRAGSREVSDRYGGRRRYIRMLRGDMKDPSSRLGDLFLCPNKEEGGGEDGFASTVDKINGSGVEKSRDFGTSSGSNEKSLKGPNHGMGAHAAQVGHAETR
jgi:hypothetical protein